jgi:hypothetical protein
MPPQKLFHLSSLPANTTSMAEKGYEAASLSELYLLLQPVLNKSNNVALLKNSVLSVKVYTIIIKIGFGYFNRHFLTCLPFQAVFDLIDGFFTNEAAGNSMKPASEGNVPAGGYPGEEE